ncbi:MAG: glycosyl transferase family 1, partial [Porphyromonadaceae bacterium CG2_30_38_12]
KDKLSIWIRGNFLIPDPRRFWIKPSVRFLCDYLLKNPVDAIITTGPPHSMHFIGLGLKKSNPNLPWIADFRDPWTNLDFYEELNLSYISDKIHHQMEKKIIQKADCIVVVSNGMHEDYKLLNPKKIEIITNGYDESDVQIDHVKLDEKFSLSHIGTLNTTRNPPILWKVLSEICIENPQFKADLQIQLIGKVDFSVLEEINLLNLNNNLLKVGYLSHQEAIISQQSSQVLLLLINQSVNAKGFVTGKFYEYLAAKRPILAIGPTDGDVATILNETTAGKIIGFTDYETTKKVILDFYSQYKSGKFNVDTKSVDRYSRKSLTAELSKILNSL